MMNNSVEQLHLDNDSLYCEEYSENTYYSTYNFNSQHLHENPTNIMSSQHQSFNDSNACVTSSTDILLTSVDDPYPVQHSGNKIDCGQYIKFPNRMFSCEICGKKVTTKHSLEQHKFTHTGEKPYPCLVCNRPFRDKSTLNRHYSVHSDEKPYVCNLCNRAFSRKCYLNDHMYVHCERKPNVCPICQASFISKSYLKFHLGLHKGERPFVCKICHRAFSRKNVLDIHQRVHTGEAPFYCEVCDKRFKSDCGFRDHMKGHTGENKTTCNICKKVLSSKFSLRKHRRICNFRCKICMEFFDDMPSLEKHKSLHAHVKQERDTNFPIIISVQSCESDSTKILSELNKATNAACIKSVNKAKNNLVKVDKLLSLKNMHVCKVCQKGFVSENSYKIHLKSHNLKKIRCKICQKGLPDDGSGMKHLCFHANQLYPCNMCKQSFKNKLSLLQHLKIHNPSKDPCLGKMYNKVNKTDNKQIKNEKTLICQLCKKQFRGQTSLNLHLQFHAIRKPYVCNICRKAFINKVLWKKHKCNISKKQYSSISRISDSEVS